MSTETAPDLDRAFDKALRELKDTWDVHKAAPKYSHLSKVDLSDVSLQSFWMDFNSNSSAPFPPPKIVTIGRVDHEFKIQLSNLWTGEMTIGDDMSIKERFHRVEEAK
jgi:hypothetical protein